MGGVIAETITLPADSATVMKAAGLGGFGAVAMASGRVPRAGPGRAVVLALRSLFCGLQKQSRRDDIVTALQQNMRHLSVDNYIVVMGAKGVGKTCAIETTLHRTLGVVQVEVAPGSLEEDIVSKVSAEIARVPARIIDPFASAKRVIFFYRLVTFGSRPIIVLQVSERTHGSQYAQLTGAVRRLTAMGLTVIVDASPNSVPPDLLSSRRQKVITVDNMPDALIMSEFHDLLESVEAIQLRHVVLAVVGGVPATAVSLNADVQSASIPEQVEVAVYKFVQEELFIAIKECSEAVRHQPKMQEIFDQFRGSSEVDCDILGTCGVELQSPDNILRVVRSQEGKPVLVPATPAIKIVLHHGLAKVPALEELRALIPQ